MRKISIVILACLIFGFAQAVQCAQIPEYMPYLYEDFEDGTIGNASTGEVALNGYGNSTGCLKFVQEGANAVAFPVQKLEENRAYKISMRVKVVEDVNVNNGSFIMYTTSEASGKQAYIAVDFSNVDFNSKEWVEVSADYTFNRKGNVVGQGGISDASGENVTVQLRIGNGNASSVTSGSSLTYYIDDVSFIPTDMQESTVPDYAEPPEPDPDDFKNRVTNGDFTETIDGIWTTTNATAEISEDVPEGSAYTKSLYVTETGNNGRFQQDINLVEGETYKLSFWAKGVSAKDGVDVIGSAIVPRFVKTDETNSRIEDASLVFSDEWTEYETIFTVDDEYKAFHFITGANGRNRTKYLITGISIVKYVSDEQSPEETIKYDTPEIRNPVISGYIAVGQTVDISCEYLGTNEKTGMVQLFKKTKDGGWASIMREKLSDSVSYTFKEADANSELKLLIVPMDITGKIGGYREVEAGFISAVLSIIPEFTSDIEGEVSADIFVSNYGEKANLVGIMVLLDDDNTCVASSYVHSQTVFGESETVTVSVLNPANKATKARLYVWEGTSDIDTTMISMAESIDL